MLFLTIQRQFKINPNPSNYYFRGNIYLEKGDYNNAIADYTDAIQRNSRERAYYIQRALAYSETKQNDRALADFDQAQQFERNFSLTEAKILVQAGRTDQALAEANGAIAKSPGYPYAYEGRGYIYEILGRKDEAIANYRKALSFQMFAPASSEALKRLGASP